MKTEISQWCKRSFSHAEGSEIHKTRSTLSLWRESTIWLENRQLLRICHFEMGGTDTLDILQRSPFIGLLVETSATENNKDYDYIIEAGGENNYK